MCSHFCIFVVIRQKKAHSSTLKKIKTKFIFYELQCENVLFIKEYG